MPFTGDDAKPALLDDLRDIGRKQALWTLLGGGTAITTALLGAAAVAPVLGGPALVCVYVLQLNKLDVERVLNDPPRPDYDTSVRARRRRFDRSFMQTPIEQATADFAESLLLMSAYLEAAVRADERGQGALRVGDTLQVQQRLVEGQRAAERAAAAANRVANASDNLADAWADSPRLQIVLSDRDLWRTATAGMRGEVDARAVFSAEAHAYVERTRLVTRSLRPVVRITPTDAEAVEANPRAAIRDRAAAFSASTLRATRSVRRSYGEKSRFEAPLGDEGRFESPEDLG